MNVLYVFPGEPLRNLFAGDRIAPSLHLTKAYRKMVEGSAWRVGKGKAAEAAMMRQIGSGTVALVGSNAPSSFKSFPADAAIIEEVDECDQENLKRVPDRFGASEFRHIWQIGNPSLEDFGIDKLYKTGDQKRWFLKCGACNESQVLDWFENVVREVSENVYESRSGNGYEVVCRKCARPLDRLGPGEWVATYPDKKVSSYTVSKLFSGSVPIEELFERFEDGLFDLGSRQVFYNADLGVPYTPKGAKLTDDLIRKAVRDFPRKSTGDDCVIGIDVGGLLHCVVLNRQGQAIEVVALRDFDELDRLMAAYDATAIIDGRPEARKAREFSDAHNGRVWICDRYDAVPKAIAWKLDENNRTIAIDRTASMDASHAALLREAITFPADAESIEDQAGSRFFEQLKATTRVFDPARRIHVWTKGVDHWRHALNLANVALEVRKRLGGSFVTSIGGYR
uniref:Putative terminase n=1 Tax=viral metagenome TaxID=1070528 RepID=A0A6M3K0M2_9ZZZZ